MDEFGLPPARQDGAQPDEFDLVRRTCNGDRSAAAELFTVVLGPLLAAIAREWNCEDLPDQFFVHLSDNNWRRLRMWSGRAPLKSWARIVARRLCAEMVKGRGSAVSFTDCREIDIATQDQTVLDHLVEGERRMQVFDAIQALESPRDRLLLRMFYFQSKRPAEIAAAIDCPLSGFYLIKSRAIDKLRRLLEGVGNSADASGR